MQYRDDVDFVDFVEYNDLGLPLAYALTNRLVQPLDPAQEMINETFNLLLQALNIEDEGFETLDELFDLSDIQDITE